MESIPLRVPRLMESLPGMASASRSHGKRIRGVSLLCGSQEGYLTFCDRLPAVDQADVGCASTILVPHDLEQEIARQFPLASLVAVSDPRALFIDALQYLQESAQLGPSSLLPDNPTISAGAMIGERVVFEDGVQVDAGVSIGSGSVVLGGTWLQAGATLGANSVVGSVGMNAYVGKDGRRRGFPHVAGVIVEAGASVGASCVIVRGILSSTRIGTGSIIGNLCNIGHGVEIGADVWMSAGTMVGGHTKVGAKATIALGCAIRDNITIGVDASVGMGSVVTKNVRDGASVFGNPAKSLGAINAGPVR